MYIPPYLYFRPAQVQQKRTQRYTTQLIAEAALACDPKCWADDAIGGDLQKKTIIISDFKLEKIDQDNKRKLKDIADLLIKQGFKVYLWQDDGPIGLNTTNTTVLLHERSAKHCTPAPASHIQETMLNEDVSSEGLQIMNYEQLTILEREMLEGHDIPIKQKPFAFIQHLNDSSFVLKDILRANPNLLGAYREPLSDYAQAWSTNNVCPVTDPFKFIEPEFIEHLEDVKLLNSINTTYPQENFDILLQNASHAHELTIVVVNDYQTMARPITGKYQNITELNILFNTAIYIDEHLERLINAFPNLQTLHVDCNDFADYKNKIRLLNNFTPPHVKIKVPYNSYDAFTVKFHEISDNPQPVELFDPSHYNKRLILDKLYLEVINQNVSIQDIANIFNKSEKFEKLIIQQNSSINIPTSTDEKVTIDNCRAIEILCPAVSPEAINELLVSCPHIERLKCDSELTLFSPLLQLVELDCRADIKNPLDLASFASSLSTHTPNLEKLSCGLNGFEEYIAWTEPKITPLVKLKEINFRIFNSGTEAIYIINYLAKLAPNLEKYDSTYLYVNNQILSNWPNLRYINADDFETDISLCKMLHQLPHCEKLSFEKGPVYEEYDLFYNDEFEQLPKELALRSLKLPGAKNPRLIAEIIKRSPNLTHLNLNAFQGCTDLFDILIEENISLEHLKKIELANSDITPSDYQKLLTLCPNLVEIDFSNTDAHHCQQIPGIIYHGVPPKPDSQIGLPNIHQPKNQLILTQVLSNMFLPSKIFLNMQIKISPPRIITD